jgi:outer membrane protein
MKLAVRITLLALAAAFGVPLGYAQQPTKPATPPAPQASGAEQPFRVAFVNARALLQGMPGYAKAESLWTKDMEGARAQGQRLQAAFDSTVQQYQQSQAMMTPTNRTAREKQLQAQSDSLQAKLQGLQEKIQAREEELLSPMRNRLKTIIDGMRAEGNYAFIIDLGSQASSNIVSYDKSLDITLKVAQRLASSN